MDISDKGESAGCEESDDELIPIITLLVTLATFIKVFILFLNLITKRIRKWRCQPISPPHQEVLSPGRLM